MKMILSLIILILSASAVFAEDTTAKIAEVKSQVEMPAIQQPMNIIPVDNNYFALLKDELGQRGCCSWHGGVCGCSGGSVVCCDNTYSPSCTCRSDGIIQN